MTADPVPPELGTFCNEDTQTRPDVDGTVHTACSWPVCQEQGGNRACEWTLKHDREELCVHRRAYIKYGIDGRNPRFWNMNSGIAVPIFPNFQGMAKRRKYPLWVYLEMPTVVGDENARTVTMPIASHAGGDPEEYVLGMIHRGEGRWVLKEMVMDWFDTHENDPLPTCESPWHFDSDPFGPTNSATQVQQKAANRYWLLTSRICVVCTMDARQPVA